MEERKVQNHWKQHHPERRQMNNYFMGQHTLESLHTDWVLNFNYDLPQLELTEPLPDIIHYKELFLQTQNGEHYKPGPKKYYNY